MTKVGEAKISRHWQVSIIKSIRPWLDVNLGDWVEFHVEDDQVIIKKKMVKE